MTQQPARPWTAVEVELMKHLIRSGVSAENIADAFAMLGWPVRSGNDIMAKAKRLNIKWPAHVARTGG